MASAAIANGRIEQLRTDLEVDRALSEGQVLRHYGVSLAALDGFALTEAYLAVTRGSYRHQRTTFVVCPARLRQSTGPALRHLAGVAEMRRLLGAAPEQWQSVAEGSPEASPLRLRPDGLKPEGALARRGSPPRLRSLRQASGQAGQARRARHRLYIPDAVWSTPEGAVAIEYDVGSYTPRQVLTKARTFDSYTRQVWGAPTLARTRHLAHLLAAGGLRADVVTAVWC